MKIIKILLGYWLEILVGGLILIFVPDIRWFLFYLLVILLLSSALLIDSLRKIIRIYQVANEGKLMSIIKKLNITPEELQKLGDEYESTLTDKQKKSLYRDAHDLGLK
jgi:hypothetical protein